MKGRSGKIRILVLLIVFAMLSTVILVNACESKGKTCGMEKPSGTELAHKCGGCGTQSKDSCQGCKSEGNACKCKDCTCGEGECNCADCGCKDGKCTCKESSCKGCSVKAKNVIFLIGDGMGSQQRRIAAIVEGKGDANHRLNMEYMTTTGVAFSHSLDAIVTDSAAAGTALATGFKTNNGCIAMSPDKKALKTILEACRDNGKSTGLITTVTIAHATPACFGSHIISRKSLDGIADQYLTGNINVLMGGGIENFVAAGPEDKSAADRIAVIKKGKVKGGREDGKNLIPEFQKKGYELIIDRNGLMGIDSAKTDKLLGLFSKGAMAYDIDRNKEKEPSIAEMTEKAIEILSKNEKGFFLMVEGGKIDWACHGHDVAAAVYDTIAFDKAVKVALDFARKNPDTIVVVVEDHETGGMAITSNVNIQKIMDLKATAEKMSWLVKKDGSNIDELFRNYANIANLTDKEKKLVQDEANGLYKAQDEWGYGGTIIAHIINRRMGVHFSTGGHTGAPLNVSAQGPGTIIFNGYYNQTEIPRKIAKLLGIELP